MRFQLFITIACTALFTSCAKLPIEKQGKDEIIKVGYGPEDMVLDEVSWKEPRLLISPFLLQSLHGHRQFRVGLQKPAGLFLKWHPVNG